jgi:hypothetical protein
MRHDFEDVDARNECGHDESEIVAAGVEPKNRARCRAQQKSVGVELPRR